MLPTRDRRTALGWGVACLLLSAAIIVEWWGLGAAPGAAAPVERPAAAATSPPAAAQSPVTPLGPLEAYAAVTERPLFNQSRRPPPIADGIAQPSVQGSLSVAGIVISGRERIAFIRQGNDRKLTRMQEGQAIGDWTIRSISTDRVTLAGRGGEAILLLQTKQAAAKAGH